MKFKTPNGDIKPIEKNVYKEAFVVFEDFTDFGQTYSTEWTDKEIIEDLTSTYFACYADKNIREIYIKKVTSWNFIND
jgi:hypothetical protein